MTWCGADLTSLLKPGAHSGCRYLHEAGPQEAPPLLRSEGFLGVSGLGVCSLTEWSLGD